MGRGARASAEADALLREAFDHRYRYPAQFGGFSALARFGAQGAEHGATVALCGPGQAEAVLSGLAPDSEADWLKQELVALSRVLWGHDYERGEGKFDKSVVDEPNPYGTLVQLHHDPHQATFCVRNGRIAMMTRRQGTLLETLRIERWHVRPDGRCLPASSVLEVWDDALAAPLRVDRYWDLYRPVGGELVPQIRKVETTIGSDAPTVRVLTLRAWRFTG